MRFLCVSDIHGHAKALRAVLEYAGGLGFDQLVACGDLLFPGPEPLEVWKLLTEHKAVCVQGIGDRALTRVDPDKLLGTTDTERQRIARLRQVHKELGELILARVSKLPIMARIPLENADELLAIHGCPVDPTEPFSPEMSDDEMNALVGDDMADIIVCGGSHVAFERYLPDVHIVGVGSVGENPAGAFASAALVETSSIGHQARLLTVPLD
ncbi:MAG: metallophosphoesterase family protein [Polyangiaceae bacterium]|nr:metallophosphoesterase family protein [Polyangiaceae bacterium]MCE7890824.1 metallophosphoesterase [Sorangiineae bacterium PRO1]MCL4753898.1 metallophosphoesterase family protein [Myxococcales bacterium]